MLIRRSITLALSLLGLFDSLYLLYTYTSPSRPMVCIGTGCDAVRASSYSSLGGIPIPVFGVAGYILLSMVIIAESILSQRSARLARYTFLAMSGFGFLVSLYLEYLQAFVIHALCAWCLTSGVVMSALFVLAIWNVARRAQEPDATEQVARARSLFAVSAAAVMLGGPAFYPLVQHGEVPPAPRAAAADVATRLVRPDSHGTGNIQAALTVVEFGDFECAVCGRGEPAVREIRSRYAGHVRFVFRQFPLERIHPFAQKAAEASECAAEQGKFWEMVEKLYGRQDDLSVDGLRRDAVEIGLDGSRFNQCLISGAMAARVRGDAEDGRALGVRATPTFFIGQQRVEGVLTAAQFSQLIDSQLARAAEAVGKVERVKAPAPVFEKRAEPQSTPSAPVGRASASAPQPALKPDAGAAAAPRGAAPAGLAAAWQAQSTTPLGLGPAVTGATCNEADAAKLQPVLIGTEELRQLMQESRKPLFVDVRPAHDFAVGHIPGAVNMPADEVAQRWSTLPKDKTLVLYESGRSSGDICAASRASGRTLLEHGIPQSQVKVYQEGFAGWERSGMKKEE